MLSAIQIPARDPLVGALLDGRYHVTGVLGRGGMGIVYEGLQQPLGRAVAIKVLGPNTASDPVVVARFLREARVASGLAHGNIVDVSDLGRLPDGRPYLVMPKVAGIDFATLMEREGRMPPARVANLLRGVAAALDLVHAKGLVHRDVKPENLMHVLRADGSETVMLLDFGIAALLAHNAVRLTADDMMCGSPAYMAPELISTGTFDRRADVYALATVAFELLAGCLPFDDELPMRVMVTKTERDAPSLSEGTSGTAPALRGGAGDSGTAPALRGGAGDSGTAPALRGGAGDSGTAPALRGGAGDRPFSDEVERVIARGLARDPTQRYASAGEFVTELAAAAGEGTAGDFAGDAQANTSSGIQLTTPAFDSTRSSDSVVTQNTRRAASLVAIAAAAAVGVLFAWWLAPRAGIAPSAQTSRATHKTAQRPQRPEFEHAAAPAPSSREPAPEGDSPERGSEPSAELLAPTASISQAGPHAGARGLRLVALPAAERAAAANDITAVPRSRAGAATPPERDHENVTRAANQELLQGHLGRAVELFARALARDPRDVVALRGLGLANERLGHTEDAARAYRKALALEPNASLAPKLRERLERLGEAP